MNPPSIIKSSVVATCASVMFQCQLPVEITNSGIYAPLSYNVYRNSSLLFNMSSGNPINVIDSDISTSTTYVYQMSTIDSNGEGDLSDSVSVTTDAAVGTTTLTVVPTINQFSLSWTKATGTCVTYTIEYSTDNFSTSLNTIAIGHTALTYNWPVTTNDTYYFRVTPKNQYMTGTTSSVVSGVAWPAQPVITPVTAISGNQNVTLNWENPANSPYIGFHVYQSLFNADFSKSRCYLMSPGGLTSMVGASNISATASGGTLYGSSGMTGVSDTEVTISASDVLFSVPIGYVGASSNFTVNSTSNQFISFNICGLTNNIQHKWLIVPLMSFGECLQNSVEIISTPVGTIPNPPTSIVVSPSYNDFALSWTAPTTGPSITSYKVYQSTILTGPYTLVQSYNTTTATISSGITAGTTYYFKVTFINSVGEMLLQNVVVNPTGSSVVLTWSAPSISNALAYYNVYYSTNNSTYTYLQSTTNSTPSAIVEEGVFQGASYYFKATSVGPGGESTLSTASSSSRLLALPSVLSPFSIEEPIIEDVPESLPIVSMATSPSALVAVRVAVQGRRVQVWVAGNEYPVFDQDNFLTLATTNTEIKVGKINTSDLTSSWTWGGIKFLINSAVPPVTRNVQDFRLQWRLPNTCGVQQLVMNQGSLWALTDGNINFYRVSDSLADRQSKAFSYTPSLQIWQQQLPPFPVLPSNMGAIRPLATTTYNGTMLASYQLAVIR